MCYNRKENGLRTSLRKIETKRRVEGHGSGRETGGRDAAAEKYNLLDHERA